MDFRGMTVADIDALIADAKDARKLAVAKDIANADADIRDYLAANVKAGDTVTIIFKDAKIDAKFVKLTDKRFTVDIDGANKSIMFSKLVLD